MINFAIGNIAQIYEIKHQNDSALYYRRQAFKIQDDPFNRLSLANFYIEYKKDNDSAKYYLDRATKKWGNDESIYLNEIYTINEYWGKFYEHAKDFEKSERYYTKALELAFRINISSYIMDSYNHLYTINQKSNNVAKANLFLLKYTIIKDSISSQQKKSLDFSAQKFLNEKESEYRNKRMRTYIIFGGLIVLIVIFLSIFIIKRNKKEKSLEERLLKNKEILKEKEEETLLLKDRVNESFDEIIKLAKDNDPEFTVKFIALYPEFCEALAKIYPDINNDTLKFCALIKLKFSTKNIAEYTYVTIRAVQIRKTRLRKKLNIPSDVDIYVWMDNLS